MGDTLTKLGAKRKPRNTKSPKPEPDSKPHIRHEYPGQLGSVNQTDSPDLDNLQQLVRNMKRRTIHLGNRKIGGFTKNGVKPVNKSC